MRRRSRSASSRRSDVGFTAAPGAGLTSGAGDQAFAAASRSEAPLSTQASGHVSPPLSPDDGPSAAPESPTDDDQRLEILVGEDALAVSLTWLATVHPYVGASIAAALVLAIILLIRWVWRALRDLFRGAEHLVAQ